MISFFGFGFLVFLLFWMKVDRMEFRLSGGGEDGGEDGEEGIVGMIFLIAW